MDSKKLADLEYQLIQLLNGGLDQAGMDSLRDWLKQDPEALDHYLRFITVHAGLSQTCIHTENLPIPDLPSDPSFDNTQKLLACPASRQTHRLWKIAAVAAMIAMAVFFFLWKPLDHPDAPSGMPCATLVEVHQAVWPSWTRSGFVQNDLRAGRWQLAQGLAKIRLPEGSEIILHAPCDFTLTGSNHLDLHTGRLGAYVPAGAEGFSVTTAGAHLVDYGTAFGVIANHNGETEAHVFAGSVGIRPAESPDNFEHRLTQGQAIAMDSDGVMSPTTRAYPQHFVSDLSKIRHNSIPGKILDLADMIGGGNGYGTGSLDTGVDPGTGQILTEPLSERRTDMERRFHPQPQNPYVDGVFVPNGDKGLNVISSTHLTFRDCPKTNGDYYDGIFNGAKMSRASTHIFHPGQLQGQAYGTSMHPAINIHTNAGITFDMDVIRAHNPGSQIHRFKALCGVSETLPQTTVGVMEFWVLVDGEVQFRHSVTEDTQDNSQLAEVKISPKNRFLTLVTTNSKDIRYNWTFFAEPVLELVPIK